MEAVKERAIEEFLNVSSGYIYGDGSGNGSGSGSGSGYGYGPGSGSGDGNGNGSGYGYSSGSGNGNGSGYGYSSGSGDGSGNGSGSGSGYGNGYSYRDISAVNGKKLYQIDGVPTRIDKVKSQVAKGAIFNRDFTFTPCYVAKYNRYFGHGEHVGDALRAAIQKYEENMPEQDRIEAFVDAHKPSKRYPNADFFEWHHKLTGSCEMGRKQFARDHEIDMDSDMTVREFISLTENDYGSETIKKLKPYYGMEE